MGVNTIQYNASIKMGGKIRWNILPSPIQRWFSGRNSIGLVSAINAKTPLIPRAMRFTLDEPIRGSKLTMRKIMAKNSPSFRSVGILGY